MKNISLYIWLVILLVVVSIATYKYYSNKSTYNECVRSIYFDSNDKIFYYQWTNRMAWSTYDEIIKRCTDYKKTL